MKSKAVSLVFPFVLTLAGAASAQTPAPADAQVPSAAEPSADVAGPVSAPEGPTPVQPAPAPQPAQAQYPQGQYSQQYPPTQYPQQHPRVEFLDDEVAPAHQPASDRLGGSFTVLFGAENLFGLSYLNLEDDDTETSTLEFSFLGDRNPTVAALGYTAPRLAVDFLMAPGITFGFSAGLSTLSGERTEKGCETSVFQDCSIDIDDELVLTGGVRAGYLLMFSDRVGFWPRAGFLATYLSSDSASGRSVTKTQVALSFQPTFVFSPMDHFAFTVTPYAYVGVAGSGNVDRDDGTGTREDISVTELGLTVGLLGWL